MDAAGAPDGAGAEASGGSSGTASQGGTGTIASGGFGNTDSGGAGAGDAGGSLGDAGATDAGSSNTTGGNAGSTGNTAGMSASGGTDTSGSGGTISGGTGGTAGEMTDAGSSGMTGECGEIDCCPDDPDKDDPGVCGCGEPDTDTDDDSALDCEDECPDDPDKTESGACGCGYEDTPECAALKAALVHRYSFDGNGNVATDSAGDADGLIVNAQLSGNGTLSLSGGTSDQYVDLPNDIISGFSSVTIEAWLTWNGGDEWQRIFDFGSSDQSEDMQGDGQTYLFLTPADASGDLRAAYTTSGLSNETQLTATTALSSTAQSHIAVVVDEPNAELALYRDGNPVDSAAFSGQLSAIEDVNNWIGKSQFSEDPELDAVLEEFRIYDSALSDSEIAESYEAGPDAGFLAP